jgi:hypothetical protein
MLGAFLLPVVDGTPIDLCDVWDSDRVLDLMETHGVAIGGGAHSMPMVLVAGLPLRWRTTMRALGGMSRPTCRCTSSRIWFGQRRRRHGRTC